MNYSRACFLVSFILTLASPRCIGAPIAQAGQTQLHGPDRPGVHAGAPATKPAGALPAALSAPAPHITGIFVPQPASNTTLARGASYSVTELHFPPGASNLKVAAINNRRSIVGNYIGRGKVPTGFLYSNGKLTVYPGEELIGINDLDMFAGATIDPVKGNHAIFGSATGANPLSQADFIASEATAMNNAGTVVGLVYIRKYFKLPAIWQNGVLNVLSPIPGTIETNIRAVNADGLILGNVRLAGNKPSATVVWTKREIKALSGLTDGVAINDTGVVVGAWRGPAGLASKSVKTVTVGKEKISNALIWKFGNIIDLGTLPGFGPSIPCAIDNKGVVVGAVSTPDNKHTVGFIYADGKIADLNGASGARPAFNLDKAEGIDNNGDIAAHAVVKGVEELLLLTPSVASPVAAPAGGE